MKESEQWLCLAMVVVVLAFIGFWVGQTNPSFYGPLTVEILGTLIGVLLAISFAETFRHDSEEKKARRFEKKLLDELFIVEATLNVEEGTMIVDRPFWESCLTSGSFNLLPDELQDDLARVHQQITWYNRDSRVLAGLFQSSIPEKMEMIQILKKDIESFRNLALNTCRRILIKHRIALR